MTTARIPGLAVAVIFDGEVVRTEVLGVANQETGELLTEHTLFEAASLSKPVFATAVLRLVERGEIDLDQPLHELLDYERLSHDPRTRLLTPRLVLSHQTGLPNSGGQTLDFQADPGEGFGYSGEGYVYLQRALEARTGMTLDEIVRREVFDPLGMEQSRFSWPEGTDLPLATPHDEAGRAQPKQQPDGNAASSLHTTAAEYARFVTGWLDGELLDDTTTAEALGPAVHLEPDEAAGEAVPAALAWGLGWGIQLPQGSAAQPLFWHAGDNGPFKAFVAFDPEAQSGIVYFANSVNGLAIGPALVTDIVGTMDPTFEWMGYERFDAPGFTERLEGAVAEGDGRYGEAAAAFRMALVADPDDEKTTRRVEWLTDILDLQQRPVEVPIQVLDRYAGTYGPRTLSVEDGGLHYQRQGGTKYRLRPLSETLFVLDGLVAFRIEMALDDRGVPTKLIGRYVNGNTDESPRDP